MQSILVSLFDGLRRSNGWSRIEVGFSWNMCSERQAEGDVLKTQPSDQEVKKSRDKQTRREKTLHRWHKYKTQKYKRSLENRILETTSILFYQLLSFSNLSVLIAFYRSHRKCSCEVYHRRTKMPKKKFYPVFRLIKAVDAIDTEARKRVCGWGHG